MTTKHSNYKINRKLKNWIRKRKDVEVVKYVRNILEIFFQFYEFRRNEIFGTDSGDGGKLAVVTGEFLWTEAVSAAKRKEKLATGPQHITLWSVS